MKNTPLIDLIEIERERPNFLIEQAVRDNKPLNSEIILEQDEKLQKLIIEYMKEKESILE